MYYIGLDIGGTNLKAGAVDSDGKIIAESSIPTGADRPQDIVFQDIVRLIREVISKSGLSGNDLKAIGMGSPGNIDYSTGTVIYNNNLGWKDFHISEMMTKEFGVPSVIENDADAAALGEVISGSATGAKRAIIITLGTGVGVGFVIDGHIFRSCEFGHMVIRSGGRECTCGRKGCFESYCSATGLITSTREAGITESDGSINGKTVFDSANKGNPKAQKVIDEYIDDLACGLANLINGLQPEVISLGGGVANQGERLLVPLREKVYAEMYKGLTRPRIVACTLGYKAGLIGAAMSARQ
jgi:glucokinase